ncbi:MAG TPA: hypothetical protein VGW78_03835 [Candidatus Babeliales bacterium]|nr:hypothetical protein [Candidatus Babeliales bacterium]
MTNKFFTYILFFLLYIHPSIITAQRSEAYSSAITWEPNGGRFGDNLLSYSRAKWLSYQFNIPVLYLPFKYSDKLMIHEQEMMYTPEQAQQFDRIVRIPSIKRYQLLSHNNTLYISHWDADVTIDWFDQPFIEDLKKNICPRQQLEKVIIPEHCLSIAVHVRNGGGFIVDTQQEKERCPLRFVPDEFYIDQIARIADMFPHQNVYVHIFTDHPEPKLLKKKFKAALNNPYLIFGYRKENNFHNTNVLEDFFSMMDFDCLIRPGSHYSRFVQRLGNNKLVIYPESFKTINGKKVINVINIKTRNYPGEHWKTKKVTII